MRSALKTALSLMSVAAALLGASPAQAVLTLTAAGISDGFVLSTFVGPYGSGGGYGPLAQAVLPSGNIVSPSSFDGKIYVFSDVDGQTLGSAVSATSYACQTGNCNYAMATAGGLAYGAQAFGGTYERFANDGSRTILPGLAAAGLRGFLGMWGNPINGHIIAASSAGLVDINPVADTFRVINAGLFPDGVSVSKDGLVAFVENGGTIQSYSIATGALIHTYFTGHAPDGTGVIYGGLFDGDIIVNNNDGTLGLLDPSKVDGDPLQFVIIASGGTRGDFVSPDTNNGTLFLSQNERVMRLTCPNCSFVPPTDVPEPTGLALFGTALFAAAMVRRRRR